MLGASGVMEAAQEDEGKQSSEQQTQHDAEFFGGDRKHEVGMTFRQDALDRSLARPASEPAAALERFESLIDVEAIARGRVTEAFDATCYMRDEHISAREPNGSDATKPRHPYEPHTGEEEQGAPDQSDQHRLPEIGLQHEPGDSEEQQRERDRPPPGGKPRAFKTRDHRDSSREDARSVVPAVG